MSLLGFAPVVAMSIAACGTDENLPPSERLGTAQQAVLTESCGQPQDGPVQGYDISEWQGDDFDWNDAKKKGIAFGYARVSYGNNHPDLTFPGNWERIKAAGLLRGAYQYFIPVQDVAEQAQIVIDAVGKLGVGDLPVQFDVEPLGWERGSLTPQQIVAKMHQWLDLVEAGTGKRPFIYTNAYLWQEAIQSADFGSYGLWMSNYGPKSGCPLINDGWSKWTIWQYTDSPIDKNVFNGTLDELLGFAGAGTGSDPYPFLSRRSSGDLDGDGKADVCARAIKGLTCALSSGGSFRPEIDGPAWNDEEGWRNPATRETIQFGDIDGDKKADVCARSEDGIVCKRFDGAGFTTEVKGPAWSDAAGWAQPSLYSTIELGDVNGDGKADLCARRTNGYACNLSDGSGFPTEIQGPAWSDQAGWNRADQYGTIQLADIDGDGKADVCARDASGVVCHLANGTGFPAEVRGPTWSNGAGWNKVQYGSTIRFVDIDGDGRADVCGRGPTGIVCALSFGNAFGPEFAGPAFSDAAGWDKPARYRTIVWGDLDGDKRLDVCGRTPFGIECHRSESGGFGGPIGGPPFSDEAGWDQPDRYATIALGDVDGDGKEDLCGRGPDGYVCAPSNGSGFGALILAADWSDAKGWRKTPYYDSIQVVGTPMRAKYDPTQHVDAGEAPPAETPPAPAPAEEDGGCNVGRGPRSMAIAPWGIALLGVLLIRRRRR